MKFVLVFILLFLPSYSTWAFDVLTSDEIRQVIGDFPLPGSQDEAEDDKILQEYQNTRTQAQCDEARAQKNLDLKDVFVAPNGPLTLAEYKSIKIGFFAFAAQVGLNSTLAKKIYNRPRPYTRNPMIKPCIPLETSSSYPSGHTTVSRAVALYLASKYPERESEFLKVADQVALNRVIGGVHHPSDIEAGKKLGYEVASRILTVP